MSTKRDSRSTQVMPRFTRDFNAIYKHNSMIKLLSILLISAFNRPPPNRYFSLSRMNPLHSRSERQEVVSSVVWVLGRSIGHAAGREQGRADLAWMDRIFHDRRAYEHRGGPIGIVEGRRARLMDGRERHVRCQSDTIARRRGCLIMAFVRLMRLLVVMEWRMRCWHMWRMWRMRCWHMW